MGSDSPGEGTPLREALARAVALGEVSRIQAPPNPWVGCVLLNDERAVGEGRTDPPGGPHAEINALAEAGPAARGATAVVTLEPCSHHGRTPPCADALVEAGVARVVVCLEDPDDLVAGRGIARLREAGIEVEVGLGAEDAARSLAPYLLHRSAGRSFVVAKVAQSLDGRVAAADGGARWVTGERSRSDGHLLRAASQAVAVGAGTALADDPRLDVRDVAQPPDPPLRVVLDSSGRVPARGALFDPDLAPTLVCTTAAAPAAARSAWESVGADVVVLDPATAGPGVDPTSVVEYLGGRGVLQLLLEGGPTVFGSFLRAGLVDKLVLYVAPLLLGSEATAMFGGPGPVGLAAAPRLAPTGVTRLGDDLRLEFEAVA